MELEPWLQVLVLGGLAGAIGQGARAAIGLKKAAELAAVSEATLRQTFEASRLVVSLIIGFIAGALAALTVLDPTDTTTAVTATTILGLVAAGYAGTDFIEGLMSRFTGAPGTTQAPANTAGSATGTGDTAAASDAGVATDGSVG